MGGLCGNNVDDTFWGALRTGFKVLQQAKPKGESQDASLSLSKAPGISLRPAGRMSPKRSDAQLHTQVGRVCPRGPTAKPTLWRETLHIQRESKRSLPNCVAEFKISELGF